MSTHVKHLGKCAPENASLNSFLVKIEFVGVFRKGFSEFSEFRDQKYLSWKGRKPATFCVRDQDDTTAPARHMWETWSFNWDQLMLRWFIRFIEFAEITEFNESSAPFRKNSNVLWIVRLADRKLQKSNPMVSMLFTTSALTRRSCSPTNVNNSTKSWLGVRPLVMIFPGEMCPVCIQGICSGC